MLRYKTILQCSVLLAIVGTLVIVTSTPAVAQTESILYSFGASSKSPQGPFDAPIFDGAGNLYGTTLDGGNFYYGSVFELSPKAGGVWDERLLLSFNVTGNGGYLPVGGLVMDAAGDLFGTTDYGGTYGHGTLFELMPQANGSWNSKLLHEFGQNSGDGEDPQASLIMDSAGNLYGTTFSGGGHGQGTVFEFSPAAGGKWTEKLLHSFYKAHGDGFAPNASLVFDSAGNLYGTTVVGGTFDKGTVFELSRAGDSWTEKVLHSFSNTTMDGGTPEAHVIFDSSGNLYSTTLNGGANGSGIVFELSPPVAGGAWTETILHSFDNNGTDGYLCVSPLGSTTPAISTAQPMAAVPTVTAPYMS